MRCRRFEKQIDAYLRGELPEKHQEKLEEHYFACEKCFDQLLIRRTLMKVNFDLAPAQEPDLSHHAASPRRLLSRPALAAASLLLMAGAGFLGLRWHRNLLIERISTFDPPTIMVTETRSPLDNRLYANAVSAYRNQNYSETLLNLERIPTEEISPKILFLAGISRLMSKDYAGAIEDFDDIIEAMAPSYFDEALFYKGIALLRKGRTREARDLFVRLEGMFSPLRTQARQKRESIENSL